jgi:ABC-type transporter Mla subunit MlaD
MRAELTQSFQLSHMRQIVLDELARVSNELARVSNELARVSNELARVSNELARVSNELARAVEVAARILTTRLGSSVPLQISVYAVVTRGLTYVVWGCKGFTMRA